MKEVKQMINGQERTSIYLWKENQSKEKNRKRR